MAGCILTKSAKFLNQNMEVCDGVSLVLSPRKLSNKFAPAPTAPLPPILLFITQFLSMTTLGLSEKMEKLLA
jgi:hypothetical protein